MPKITTTYEMSAWNENTNRDLPPPQKCTNVIAPGKFSGAMEGEGESFYLLNYITEKTGFFTGYTCFKGKIGAKQGSFVLADDGIFDEKGAYTKWTIVKGSGTADLISIKGTGGFSATEGMKITIDLNYQLPE